MSTTIKASELSVGMELEYLGGWHEIMDMWSMDLKDADEGAFPVVVVQLRDMDLGKLPWFYRSIAAEKDVMVRCGQTDASMDRSGIAGSACHLVAHRPGPAVDRDVP